MDVCRDEEILKVMRAAATVETEAGGGAKKGNEAGLGGGVDGGKAEGSVHGDESGQQRRDVTSPGSQAAKEDSLVKQDSGALSPRSGGSDGTAEVQCLSTGSSHMTTGSSHVTTEFSHVTTGFSHVTTPARKPTGLQPRGSKSIVDESAPGRPTKNEDTRVLEGQEEDMEHSSEQTGAEGKQPPGQAEGGEEEMMEEETRVDPIDRVPPTTTDMGKASQPMESLPPGTPRQLLTSQEGIFRLRVFLLVRRA